jgi:hypothetical protein
VNFLVLLQSIQNRNGDIMRFEKSRWVLLALILSLLLSACEGSPIQTTSPGISNQQGNKLVVIVQGIGSSLSTEDIEGNNGYGDTDFGVIESSLKKSQEFSNAQFMVYSYTQVFGLDGQPATYDCNTTFSQKIALDKSQLAAQITGYTTNHKDTQVYIVAHSLGGVLAFAFLADSVQNSLSLANGGVLKGIAILDSPLGGVTNNPTYFNALWLKIHSAFLGIGPGCNFLHIGTESYADLVTLFKNAQDKTDLGTSTSIYKYILGTTVQPRDFVLNENVATQAANQGARILVVGNTNDILWHPDLCKSSMPNFLSTEYLHEVGEQNNGGALYVRSFTGKSFTGMDACQPKNIAASHSEVLKRTDVAKAILEIFTGKSVDVLNTLKKKAVSGASTAVIPTVQPTPKPTISPTPIATKIPRQPTKEPTVIPTPEPTKVPRQKPTPVPTQTSVGVTPILSSGTWQDSSGGASYVGDSVILTLTVQGNVISGTITGGSTGRSTTLQGHVDKVVSLTLDGEFEGAPAESTYSLVKQQNDDLLGAWFFPSGTKGGDVHFVPGSSSSTSVPTPNPNLKPTVAPTPEPTQTSPTPVPTAAPTPTPIPTAVPTPIPTPTMEPTPTPESSDVTPTPESGSGKHKKH